MMKRKGFSLLELLIGFLILSIGIGSFLWLNRMSNQVTMDSYYRLLATRLAWEPVEVCRAIGFSRLSLLLRNSPNEPLKGYSNEWIQVPESQENSGGFPRLFRPPEASLFERKVVFGELSDGMTSHIAISVEVRLKGESAWGRFLKRNVLQASGLIWEKVP